MGVLIVCRQKWFSKFFLKIILQELGLGYERSFFLPDFFLTPFELTSVLEQKCGKLLF